MNLIIRTEERPKLSTVAEVLNIVYNYKIRLNENQIKIEPILDGGRFTFIYSVNIDSKIFYENNNINNIRLEIVSGSSSFIDYLIYKEENNETLIAMIEETKTDDSESRNTGVYQRASKFVYANILYPNTPKYMLYTNENNSTKRPSQTAIFGTKLLKTIGVKIVGKSSYYNSLEPFNSIEEIIDFKSKMRRPPEGNTPILIKKSFNKENTLDEYFISGILSKPSTAGNIAHDPNIGALTLIASGIRKFDKTSPIFITHHGVSQQYITRARGNKFLYIAYYLNIYLYGLKYRNHFTSDDEYYHEERSSEKVTTIFLHVLMERNGSKLIYENHAGCERGYFYMPNKSAIALPKKINNQILYIPDLVLLLPSKIILLIEGKKLSTLDNGVKELENYGLLEKNYIKKYNPIRVERWVTTFGGNISMIPHEKVLIHINDNGSILINKNAPKELRDLF